MKTWLGGGFWVATVIALIIALAGDGSAVSSAPGRHESLIRVLWPRQTTIQVLDPIGNVNVGDGVFAIDSQGKPIQVGDVRRILSENPSNSGGARKLALTLYVDDEEAQRWDFISHQISGQLDEVFFTLLPPAKRDRMRRKIADALDQHGDAITAGMMPLVMQSFRESLPWIQRGLVDAFHRHEKEMDALFSRYRQKLLREQLMPLAKEEMFPILRKHAEEPAREIGKEIWGRASLFRFGWRAVYDQSPLPKKELLKDEFERFVDEDVLPVMESHLDEILIAFQKTVVEISENDRVRAEISDMAKQVAADPEARDWLRRVVTEAVIENAALRDAWSSIWNGEQARKAMQEAARRIEPIVREITDEVIGTRQGGIDPDFARVLRNQILGRDRTWLTVQPRSTSRDPGDVIQVIEATQWEPYPVVHLAKP